MKYLAPLSSIPYVCLHRILHFQCTVDGKSIWLGTWTEAWLGEEQLILLVLPGDKCLLMNTTFVKECFWPQNGCSRSVCSFTLHIYLCVSILMSRRFISELLLFCPYPVGREESDFKCSSLWERQSMQWYLYIKKFPRNWSTLLQRKAFRWAWNWLMTFNTVKRISSQWPGI